MGEINQTFYLALGAPDPVGKLHHIGDGGRQQDLHIDFSFVMFIMTRVQVL